jgi:alpha-ketoglutarate-dependent taurine dioxygenase
MTVQIRNLSAAQGAEATGIDLSGPLPKHDVDAIEAAWRERLVVFLRAEPFRSAAHRVQQELRRP